MFNHYSVRPIGSARFERHLAGLMKTGIEKQEEARANIPTLPVVYRKDPTDKPTEFDPIMEGYKALALAILAQAVWDYLDEYELRLHYEDMQDFSRAYVHECRCLTLENEYFRKDDENSEILDCILRYVIHNREDHGKLRYRQYRIRAAKGRLSKLIHQPLM